MSDSAPTDNPGSENSETPQSAEGDTAPTQQEPDGGSASTGTTGTGEVDADSGSADGADAASQAEGAKDSDTTGAITDQELPEDLQPTDDNPLAKDPDPEADDEGMSLGPDGPEA